MIYHGYLRSLGTTLIYPAPFPFDTHPLLKKNEKKRPKTSCSHASLQQFERSTRVAQNNLDEPVVRILKHSVSHEILNSPHFHLATAASTLSTSTSTANARSPIPWSSVTRTKCRRARRITTSIRSNSLPTRRRLLR